MSFGYVLVEGMGKVGDAGFEVFSSSFGAARAGFVVGEEAMEDVGTFKQLAEAKFADFGTVLIAYGGAGVFENKCCGLWISAAKSLALRATPPR